MIKGIFKQITTIQTALVGVALLFLFVGCSVISIKQSVNWQGRYYVVDTQSVESLREMFIDTGHLMFDMDNYSKARIQKLDGQCSRRYFRTSKFVGDIEDEYGNLKRYCTVPFAYPAVVMVETCRQLGLAFAWAKPKERKFACGRREPIKRRA